MSLNPTGNNFGWNYSNPEKDGYSTSLTGTVAAIQEVQKRGYTMNGQPGSPQFWPDGNPIMNIRMLLVQQDGTFKSFVFQPAGKEQKAGNKPSIHMDLFALTGNTDMTNLIGKTITIWTEEPPAGFKYGQGNPRPWHCRLENMGPFTASQQIPAEYQAAQVLCDNAASGGQVINQGVPPHNIQQPVTTYATQPAATQTVTTAQPAQPVATTAVAQPGPSVPLPTQPAVPDGMDPAVAAAMASMGATNIQPVAEQSSIYDEEVPF